LGTMAASNSDMVVAPLTGLVVVLYPAPPQGLCTVATVWAR